MSAQTLLARLEKVKKRGRESRWTARCPAHADRSPSLSIWEPEADKILIKCHAGCAAVEIVTAVGLELSDLFPTRNSAPSKPATAIKRPWRVQDMIQALDFEMHVIWVLLAEIEAGRPMDADRRRRAGEAKRRACRFIEELANVH